MNKSKLYRHAKPYLAVILLQFGRAGNAIIAKHALNQGMSHYTLVVYRAFFAALVFAPFAIPLERKIRPRMTISIFFKIVLLGLIEPVIDQNLYYAGMKYTTATFAAAMTNTLPALTFLMAWLLRLEIVSIGKLRSQAKVLGTLVSVGGAMIMTLVNGPIVVFPWTKHGLNLQSGGTTDDKDPIRGAIMITIGCFCWAGFHILQAITLKSYPAGLSLTTLLCTAGGIQGTILTLIMERGNSAIWALHWDSKLLAYAYSGIICSGVAYYISGVVMEEKGPVFVTAFNPLTMVIVAIMSSFLLAEQLHFGRVLGAFIIVGGLYIFIWGKSKEQVSASNCDQEKPAEQQIPSTSDKDNIQVSSPIAGNHAV